MRRKKSVSYEEGLHERLKDSAYAAEYLNAHLSEDDDHAVEAFLLALRDVATAHGFANVAKKSELGRESLYKTLSKSGNPKIETLSTLLKTMGLKLSVEAKPVKRKRAS
jgi:probable addiction module antidote protein